MSDMLREIADAARAERAARERADAAAHERDELIRRALAAGVRVAEIVQVTGLHRQRIYQIRDRRRCPRFFSSVLDSNCIARYTRSMMNNEITAQITTAYQTILARKGRRHGDWITLTDLRIELDESFPRYEIDEALRE